MRGVRLCVWWRGLTSQPVKHDIAHTHNLYPLIARSDEQAVCRLSGHGVALKVGSNQRPCMDRFASARAVLACCALTVV